MPRLTRRQRDQRKWNRYVAAWKAGCMCAKGRGAEEQGAPMGCWRCGPLVVTAEKRATRAGSK